MLVLWSLSTAQAVSLHDLTSRDRNFLKHMNLEALCILQCHDLVITEFQTNLHLRSCAIKCTLDPGLLMILVCWVTFTGLPAGI